MMMAQSPVQSDLFFQAACKLILAKEDTEQDEVRIYNEWRGSVQRLRLIGRNGKRNQGLFFETPYSAWYTKNVIFKHFKDSYTRRVNGDKIWSSMSAATVSVSVKELTKFINSESSPNLDVVFIVGGRISLVNRATNFVVHNLC